MLVSTQPLTKTFTANLSTVANIWSHWNVHTWRKETNELWCKNSVRKKDRMCFCHTRPREGVSWGVRKHVLQDSIQVTSSRLNCEASSYCSWTLGVALDTQQGGSSEHMSVRILVWCTPDPQRHAERCLLLNYVSMGLYSEGVVFVACPPQPALGSFPDQHRPWLHGRWHSKEWFSPPFREACRLWFSMWVQWCGLLSAPSTGGLCPQSRKQAGRLRGHLILIDTVKFPVMSPGGSGARL